MRHRAYGRIMYMSARRKDRAEPAKSASEKTEGIKTDIEANIPVIEVMVCRYGTVPC